MTRGIISGALTTCDTTEDGQTIRLDFLDETGEPVSVAFPFRQAASVMMTLPRLLSKALQQQTRSDTARYVLPLGRWSIESSDQPCLIMTLITDDGFEVSFGIPFETCRAMGWALKEEGRKAAAVPAGLN
jgi:hypothetical protein